MIEGIIMTRFICVALAAAFLLCGCAKRPGSIVPANIPVSAYANLNCSQLAEEQIAETEKLAALSKSQNKAATADAVGVFLVGVPAGSLTGNDQEGDIAVSKGKIQAIEAAQKNKAC